MKTILTCLFLCIAALWFGKRQQGRIEALERRLIPLERPHRMGDRADRDAGADGYRTKSRERAGVPTAAEVYETVLSLLEGPRSVSGGPEVVMANRKAFQAILRLDLAGQEELIRLIAHSNDPKLNRDRALYKCEQINVCLCAMADRHPEAVLAYLRDCDGRIGKFYQNWIDPNGMIRYAIRRMCEWNPAAGLDALVEMAADPKRPDGSRQGGYDATEILTAVAEHDPDLALTTIPRLPEACRIEPLRRLLQKADSDEECARRFQLLRHGLRDDSAAMTTAVGTLLNDVIKRNMSWRKTTAWMEGLQLTDQEKLHTAAVFRWGLGGDAGEDLSFGAVKWLAGYLPPSKERDFILWTNASQGLWMAMDPAGVKAFLEQQSIDGEEMERLEREGFMKPYWQ